MITCVNCGSANIQRRGFNRSAEGANQRFQCMNCSKWFSAEEIDAERSISKQAKIAILDVETLPSKAFVWGMWGENISPSQLIQEGCLLSWGGKLLNESGAEGYVLSSREAIDYNPLRITKLLWEYMRDIDIFIGHNFQDFDRKVINTAFLMANLPPLKYKVIDTLKVAREQFKFASNKMSYINDKLGIRNKISNEGFALWKKCSEGKTESLKTMLEYNIGDLYSTETLYYQFRAYVPNHPDLALYNDINEMQCPVCLSKHLKREGYYPPVKKARYESVRCLECGALSRLNTNRVGKEKRANFLRS